MVLSHSQKLHFAKVCEAAESSPALANQADYPYLVRMHTDMVFKTAFREKCIP